MKDVPPTIRALAFVLLMLANATWASEPAPEQSVRKPAKLPGMVIDFEKRQVDLQATVCLDNGFLELVACAKGSKEHESIVAVAARPMHIHTALLLLGANNGNPATRKQIGEEEKRWVNVPPRGDPIDVFLVTTKKDGKAIERPISDFIVRSSERVDEVDGA
ncbi:MAG: YdjY domain-containing protein, partial [Planctomycetales bacterium]